MAKRIHADWSLPAADLPAAVKQLQKETPISWGPSDERQEDGPDLEAGELTISFSKDRSQVFIRFEAPAPKGFRKTSWLSPIDLLGKSAYDFGRKEA